MSKVTVRRVKVNSTVGVVRGSGLKVFFINFEVTFIGISDIKTLEKNLR